MVIETRLSIRFTRLKQFDISKVIEESSALPLSNTMAAVDVGVRDVPPINDDLDELFNYDVDNDLLRELDTNMDVAPKQSTTSRVMEGGLDSGLGLDEEIKITKKRAPIAKLDETRYDLKAMSNLV